jgi:hypothetical protein
MHFLYRILTPHKFSLRRYAVTHLQPKPSLQKRDQKPAVVAFPHKDFCLRVSKSLCKRQIFDRQPIGEVDFK